MIKDSLFVFVSSILNRNGHFLPVRVRGDNRLRRRWPKDFSRHIQLSSPPPLLTGQQKQTDEQLVYLLAVYKVWWFSSEWGIFQQAETGVVFLFVLLCEIRSSRSPVLVCMSFVSLGWINKAYMCVSLCVCIGVDPRRVDGIFPSLFGIYPFLLLFEIPSPCSKPQHRLSTWKFTINT